MELIGFEAGPWKVGICRKILIANVGRYLQLFDNVIVVIQILPKMKSVLFLGRKKILRMLA